jgi:hypothetical protein
MDQLWQTARVNDNAYCQRQQLNDSASCLDWQFVNDKSTHRLSIDKSSPCVDWFLFDDEQQHIRSLLTSCVIVMSNAERLSDCQKLRTIRIRRDNDNWQEKRVRRQSSWDVCHTKTRRRASERERERQVSCAVYILTMCFSHWSR